MAEEPPEAKLRGKLALRKHALRQPKGSVGEHQTINKAGQSFEPTERERRPAQSLVLPKDFKCKVSKEFIDEMATIADRCNKMKEQTGQMDWPITPLVPKRLRKLEEAYERNELQKMRRMHYESAVVENTNAGVSGAEGTLSTGQNVHHWWAGWFKTATKPKDQIAKKHRPKWSTARVSSRKYFIPGCVGRGLDLDLRIRPAPAAASGNPGFGPLGI